MMLNEKAKIYSVAVLVSMEEMMQQLVPRQQVGFMKGGRMMDYVAHVLQRIEDTHWFVGAYDKTTHEFLLVGEMGVPAHVCALGCTFPFGVWHILVGNAVVGDPFPLEAGVQQGDPLSPMLFVFATSFLMCRIHWAGLDVEHFSDSVIDLPLQLTVLKKVLKLLTTSAMCPICGAIQKTVSCWFWSWMWGTPRKDFRWFTKPSAWVYWRGTWRKANFKNTIINIQLKCKKIALLIGPRG